MATKIDSEGLSRVRYAAALMIVLSLILLNVVSKQPLFRSGFVKEEV